MEFRSDDLLPLSGIQHFMFCRRQWALIHVENQWRENALTIQGKALHKHADEPFVIEKRRGVIVSRSVPIASYTLGLSGKSDIVEFTESSEGVHLPGRVGYYKPVPVEYKRGSPKNDRCDEAQLCAQAMCLEEMLSTEIPLGYLFYGETKHREEVIFDDNLRSLVTKMCAEMHAYFARGYTPLVKRSRACRSCSLMDICLPEFLDNATTASLYIKQHIEND